MRLRFWCLTVVLALALVCPLSAAEMTTGTVILHGGGAIQTSVRLKFLELAGGESARLVVIPTADYETPLDPSRVEAWRARNVQSVQLLHAASREESEPESFAEPLRDATGVWISGGWQTRLASTYLRTPVERELAALLKRGGVIFGTSAGAAVLSRVMLVRTDAREGFDLVPECVIDQHFLVRNRQERLWNVLAQHPHRIGIGIDEDTAAVIQGDRLSVLGDSTVSICIAAHGSQSQQVQQFKSGESVDLHPMRIALTQRR
ncbi:MAG TPA: cyanophycinase [Planctomycetaceae bacterium]|nr:cyanophycinase [Planctomycetaceae bacterium]